MVVLGLLKDSKNLPNVILLAGILFNGYGVQNVTKSIGTLTFQAETNYAMSVVTYGLGDKTDKDDIFKQVQTWHKSNSGCQIGAIRTICDVQPNRLFELMDIETAKSVCRIARI